jgi:hypothetical protein
VAARCRISVYLVRVLPSSRSSLPADAIVWLVVIRDATIPSLGPRFGAWIQTLAVFVSTDKPRFLESISF